MTTLQARPRPIRHAPCLEALRSQELRRACVGLPTGGVIRAFLLLRNEVPQLRDSLREGRVTDDDLREFVTDLLRAFRPGERLAEQVALAALAVALETRHSDFTDSFLEQLASSPLAELGPASQVACACLKHRGTESRSRVFCVGDSSGGGQSYLIEFDANPTMPHHVEEGVHSGHFELSDA